MPLDRTKFQSLLGMHEMEKAVEFIANKAADQGVSFREVALRAEDYRRMDDFEITGILQLAVNGFLENAHCTKATFPGRELTLRVIERIPELGPVGDSATDRMLKMFFKSMDELDAKQCQSSKQP